MASFGTNPPEYNDSKIKFYASESSFYIMSKVKNDGFLFLSLSLNGKLKVGYYTSPQHVSFFKIPIYTEGRYLRTALSLYQPQIKEGFTLMFSKLKTRIPKAEVIIDEDRSFMLFKALLYFGGLKSALIGIGYRVRWEELGNNKKKIVIFRTTDKTSTIAKNDSEVITK